MKKILNRHTYLFLLAFNLLSLNREMISQASSHYDSHIGLFDSKTTFSLSSDIGVLPTLDFETKDVYGNTQNYKSHSGSIVVSESSHQSKIKSATLKGKTLVNVFDFDDSLMWRENENRWRYETPIWDVEPGDKYYAFFFNELNNLPLHIKPIDENSNQIGQFNLEANSGKIVTLDDKVTHVMAYYYARDGWTGQEEKEDILEKCKILFVKYQEGVEHWDVSHFKGTQSVVNPVLTISNEDETQTATISIEEEVVLRSNGDVYDELDLMTGKLTQRIAEDGGILDEEIVRYVKINSTHTFEVPNEGDVSVVGSIIPTIVSVDIPSEALSFTLNPNLETRQQFIASDFSISNNSRAPIKLGIQSFEQTTTLLNDVLPDKYDSWEGLNKTQSKDIALALEPQPSNSWISLNEGLYYVANTSSVELGQIKGNSTVDFKFSALHGQAFAEPLNPQYRLTFVFEL